MKQKVITNVFDSWEETIIWSCLQGVMGGVYTNDEEDAAMAILGDFVFYAGKPSEEVVRFKSENCIYTLASDPDEKGICKVYIGEASNPKSTKKTRISKQSPGCVF